MCLLQYENWWNDFRVMVILTILWAEILHTFDVKMLCILFQILHSLSSLGIVVYLGFLDLADHILWLLTSSSLISLIGDGRMNSIFDDRVNWLSTCKRSSKHILLEMLSNCLHPKLWMFYMYCYFSIILPTSGCPLQSIQSFKSIQMLASPHSS